MPDAENDDLIRFLCVRITQHIRRPAKWHDQLARARNSGWPAAIWEGIERLYRASKDAGHALSHSRVPIQ